MKNLLYILFFITVSCNSYEQVNLLVGKEYFDIKHLKNEAPYEDEVSADNRTSFTNLPESLQSSFGRKNKDWDEIIQKYKVECRYFVHKEHEKTHIRRVLSFWPTDSINNINTPEKLYDYLKENNISDFRILAEKKTDFGLNESDGVHTTLLLYNGVKHQLTLLPKKISAKSYLEKDKDYWESQGSFMLDTPIEVFEKYKNVNR